MVDSASRRLDGRRRGGRHRAGLAPLESPLSASRRTRLAAVLLASVLAGAGLTPALSQDEPPGLAERVEVRLIQVAVAVVDPKAGTRASVPGLSREQFEVLIDGRPLSDEARARLTVDEICAEPEGEFAGEDPTSRHVIGVVDFNYLDARTRHLVADSLDRLAREGLPPGVRIKIYGLTRQVRRITPGFVAEPEALRRAAREIRGESFSRKQIAEIGGLPEGAANAGAPLNEPFGTDDAPGDPRSLGDSLASRLRAGFGSLAENDARQLEMLFGDSREADFWPDAKSTYDPLASLAAIEGIMRAHQAVAGQKALVLFTSEAFRIARQDVLADAIEQMANLARRENFTIFTVDTEGLGGQRRRNSELLSALAADSGGASVRRTGDLSRGFAQALEQLSCYYLLSVPISAEDGGASRHTLAVRLDTDRFPELWGLSVRAPTSLVLPSSRDRVVDERLAVLFSPEDFPDPPLEVLIEYPRTLAHREVMPVRYRVPLSALAWKPIRGGSEARVLFEGLLERDRGRGLQIVCRTGPDQAGQLTLRRRGTAPPRADSGLVFEMFCGFERAGLYTARGVLTDLDDDRSGGGRSTVFVRLAAGEDWRLDEPRLLASNGRDLLWRTGWKAARKDSAHRAYFVADTDKPLDAGDRLRFDGVLCGPGGSRSRLPHAVVLRKTGEGEMSAYQTFSVPESLAAAADGEKPFCAPLLVEIEEYSLEPGSYALQVVLPDGTRLAERRFEIR